MKILYHHRVASKDGQDVHISEMIAAMKRAGHEVILVAPAMAESSDFGYDGGLVARLRRLLPATVYELMEFAYSLVAYRRLKAAYDAHKPDLLYERYTLFFLPGLWLKKRTGIPYVVEVNAPLAQERAVHDGLRLQKLGRWTERLVWRGADLALPVTDVLADHLRAAGVPEERIRVIPNGINRQRFPEQGPEQGGENARLGAEMRAKLGLEGKLVLGFTGFIREWHGLPKVVDAMASLPNRDQVHLLVIGEGPARAELEAHAARCGMGAQVTCTGLVGRDEVASYVATFDIALQPMVVDYASPLKLFEYMALGRAIIAPDLPNIREILTDEQDSLLFRAQDDDHFKAQIARICSDAGLRQRLGEGAAETVRRRDLTWDGNVRRALEKFGG